MTPKSEEQPPPSGEERFTALWDAYAGRVFAYTCRHVDHHSAQEVVSETFLVACDAWTKCPSMHCRGCWWWLETP